MSLSREPEGEEEEEGALRAADWTGLGFELFVRTA